MNLMERNTHEDQNDWREDIKSDLHTEPAGQEELPAGNPVEEQNDEEEVIRGGLSEILLRPVMTPVLLDRKSVV